MKINLRTLQAFNAMEATREMPVVNDLWNKANNRPTREEYNYLKRLKQDTFGMFGGMLTPKHLRTS